MPISNNIYEVIVNLRIDIFYYISSVIFFISFPLYFLIKLKINEDLKKTNIIINILFIFIIIVFLSSGFLQNVVITTTKGEIIETTNIFIDEKKEIIKEKDKETINYYNGSLFIKNNGSFQLNYKEIDNDNNIEEKEINLDDDFLNIVIVNEDVKEDNYLEIKKREIFYELKGSNLRTNLQKFIAGYPNNKGSILEYTLYITKDKYLNLKFY